jgi:hypothetical protein
MSDIEAQGLAYALEMGAADLADARAWADSQIATAVSPRDELLALATEHNLAHAISLLHVLGAGASAQDVGKLVYRWLLRAVSSGELTHERAAEAVVRLTRESSAPSPDAESQSWHFDDAFYLARHEMYGTEAEVAAELVDHLRRYAA